MELQIDQLAIHYIDPPNKIISFSKAPETIAALNQEIVDFFLRMVGEVVDCEDAGPTYSARFSPTAGAASASGPSPVAGHVQNILADPAVFFDESKAIAKRLFDVSARVCSPGVLAVISLHAEPDRRSYVCLVKIRYEDRNFIALAEAALTELTVENISHMLLDVIQKGAIIPHPGRQDYELKLIDKQVKDEPARYFKEDFLGCWTKVSDENQVHGLVKALDQFAKEQHVTLQKEKIPELIKNLQTSNQDIKTPVLVEAAVSATVFEPPVEKEKLTEFIEEKSAIGPVDIPRQSFTRRGKKGLESRQIRYSFSDSQYPGVVLSGPAEVLSELLTVDGDTVTFTIKTSRIGFKVEYV